MVYKVDEPSWERGSDIFFDDNPAAGWRAWNGTGIMAVGFRGSSENNLPQVSVVRPLVYWFLR
ncbi:MAG TPA: hypothetical protein VK152_06140 [Paludibacter sp.]|nr:hypothetical protein [Paludibacter sp.]